MKIKTSIILILIIGCSRKNETTNLPDGSQIPPEAMVQQYDAVPGLVKAAVKSGEQTLREGDFLNGLHHGSWTTYDSDGRVTQITTYLNGLKQGTELSFDNQGFVSTKSYYHNDLLEGECLVYERRQLVERRNYSGGVKHGLQVKYYKTGVVMEETNYFNDKIDGVARWYDQEGNMTIEYNYNKGVRID